MLLVGPPGVGKGTQATVVAGAVGIPAISTGDIFRANVVSGTPLGRKAKKYLDAGDYVPDEVTNGMVRDRLGKHDAKHGWLLDGYPRTLAQLEELDRIAAVDGHDLDAVVALDVDDSALIPRLMNRALEQGRSDDTEEIIRRRQQVYDVQTAPLLREYQRRQNLVVIDGNGSVPDVTTRILGALRAMSIKARLTLGPR